MLLSTATVIVTVKSSSPSVCASDSVVRVSVRVLTPGIKINGNLEGDMKPNWKVTTVNSWIYSWILNLTFPVYFLIQ